MGDRAQVYIEDEKVYLYTHWTATELPDIVRAALKRGQDRWDDSEYLARIIFCEMVKEDIMGLTGYGIGCGEHSDINLLIKINCEKKTVDQTGRNGTFHATFEEYIADDIRRK